MLARASVADLGQQVSPARIIRTGLAATDGSYSVLSAATGSAKYVVNVHDVHGQQIGDHNVQRNVFPED